MVAEADNKRDAAEAVETPAADDAAAKESVSDESVAAEEVVSEEAESSEKVSEEESPEPELSEEKVSDEKVSEEEVAAAETPSGEPALHWYMLRVQVNREDSVRAALQRRIEVAGLADRFGEIHVPTEDVVEFTKSGKRRVVKRKLFPGYIMIQMDVEDDDSWFLVRETPGVGDFMGARPPEGSRERKRGIPMEPAEVDRLMQTGAEDEEEAPVKMAIPFRSGDRVRIKEGHFENYEGEVEQIDESNGLVTVIITIFGRSVPVKLEHWHLESV